MKRILFHGFLFFLTFLVALNLGYAVWKRWPRSNPYPPPTVDYRDIEFGTLVPPIDKHILILDNCVEWNKDRRKTRLRDLRDCEIKVERAYF